jgi:hypothetical protein
MPIAWATVCRGVLNRNHERWMVRRPVPANTLSTQRLNCVSVAATGPDCWLVFYFVLNIAAGRTTFTASTSDLFAKLQRITLVRFSELIERLIDSELIKVEGDPTSDRCVRIFLQTPPDFKPINLTGDRKFYIPDSRRHKSWK